MPTSSTPARLILSAVLRRTRVKHLTVSESDILDGIAWSLTAHH